MLTTQALIHARVAARKARPEPHSRLRAAMQSAEQFAANRNNLTPLDVELMGVVTDIAEDTLSAIMLMREVARLDMELARQVLASAKIVRDHAPTTAPHLDTLVQKIDDMESLIINLTLRIG